MSKGVAKPPGTGDRERWPTRHASVTPLRLGSIAARVRYRVEGTGPATPVATARRPAPDRMCVSM